MGFIFWDSNDYCLYAFFYAELLQRQRKKQTRDRVETEIQGEKMKISQVRKNDGGREKGAAQSGVARK